MQAIVGTIRGRRAVDRDTGWLRRVAQSLRVRHRRMLARRLLAQIDARTLRDAGIDPMGAHYEATQPFWIAERRLRDR